MNSAQLAPAIILPLVIWRIYVRVRRTVGRQVLQVNRLKVRVAVFAVIAVLIGALSLRQPGTSLGLLGGLVGGAALAWLGLRLTKFDATEQGAFYTPNTVIGVVLSLLLVGRIVYRFTVVYHAMKMGVIEPGGTAMQSPLTLSIFGLTVGYYVSYYVGIIVRAKHLRPATEVTAI